jgi:hypothetical protein
MTLNSCVIKGIRIYEVPSIEALVQSAYDLKTFLLPINESQLRNYYKLNTNNAIRWMRYPQDNLALAALEQAGLHHSITVAPYDVFTDIMKRYGNSSRFCFIGSDHPILKATTAVLKKHYPHFNSNNIVLTSDTNTDLKAIKKSFDSNCPDFVFIDSSAKHYFAIELVIPLIANQYKSVFVAAEDSLSIYLENFSNYGWFDFILYTIRIQWILLKKRLHFIKFKLKLLFNLVE